MHLGVCNGSHPNEAPYLNGISEQQAWDMFRNRLPEFEQDVWNNIHMPLTQTQFDALVSLAYNRGSVSNTTVALHLNNSDYAGAAQAWLTQSIHAVGAGPDPLPGLIRRREFEATLFRDGIYRMDW